MIIDVTVNIHDKYLDVNIPDHILLDEDRIDDYIRNYFFKNVKITDLSIQLDW